MPSEQSDAVVISPVSVVLAPNAFKGSLAAQEVAAAMAVGVRRVLPTAVCDVVPMADGGDGSIDAFVAAGFTRHAIDTHGPTDAIVHASFASLDDVAVVELATSCGLGRLPDGQLAPMTSTTRGLGDAILAALDVRPATIIVCLGGSASTDGGTGLLVALGARLLDDDGDDVPPGGRDLRRIANVDLAGLDPRLARLRIRIAADVTSPLVGPAGAAAVFGPQKGATPDEVELLDDGLRSWSRVLARATGGDVSGTPGAGAAGGAAAALLALGATLVPGADLLADLLGLDDRIAGADLVITGEGRLDAQSALGKGAAMVAARAALGGVPALAVCGSIDLDDANLHSAGFDGWADCLSRAAGPDDAMARATELVVEATAEAVRRWRDAGG